MSATVRISPESHAKLKALAAATGEPMPAVLDKAIEEYQRKQFLASASAAYEELRKDPQAWAEELAERAAWDQTLLDGLENDE